MTTLTLKITPDVDGLEAVKQVLRELQTVVGQGAALATSVQQMQKSMQSVRSESLALRAQLESLNATQQKVKATTASVTQAEQAQQTQTNKTTDAVKKKTTATQAGTAAKERMNAVTRQQTELQRNLHSALRGTTGALGGLWLSYGRLVPLVSAFAAATGLRRTAIAGGNFEWELAYVKGLTSETSDTIRGLSDEILRLNDQNIYGPTEMAKGLRILSQAGLNATQSITALPPVLTLATLGEMSLADAATVAQTAMHAFDLTASDIPHVVDSIAKTASMSATNVREMAAAITNASQVGVMYGVSLDETNASLGVLAQRHLVGQVAGTSFTNMLRDIGGKSEKARDMIKSLGIEIYDAAGEMRPLVPLLGEISNKLANFTPEAQASIMKEWQNRRGMKAFVPLLAEANRALPAMYMEILKSSDDGGFANKVVKELTDTLKGDAMRAASQFEGTLIRAFQSVSEEARGVSGALSEMLTSDGFRQMVTNVIQSTVSVMGFLIQHRDTVLSVAKAYLYLKVTMTAATLMQAPFAMVGRLFTMKAAAEGTAASIVLLSRASMLLQRTLIGMAAYITVAVASTMIFSSRQSEAGGSVRYLLDEVGRIPGVLDGLVKKIGETLPWLAQLIEKLYPKNLTNSIADLVAGISDGLSPGTNQVIADEALRENLKMKEKTILAERSELLRTGSTEQLIGWKGDQPITQVVARDEKVLAEVEGRLAKVREELGEVEQRITDTVVGTNQKKLEADRADAESARQAQIDNDRKSIQEELNSIQRQLDFRKLSTDEQHTTLEAARARLQEDSKFKEYEAARAREKQWADDLIVRVKSAFGDDGEVVKAVALIVQMRDERLNDLKLDFEGRGRKSGEQDWITTLETDLAKLSREGLAHARKAETYVEKAARYQQALAQIDQKVNELSKGRPLDPSQTAQVDAAKLSLTETRDEDLNKKAEELKKGYYGTLKHLSTDYTRHQILEHDKVLADLKALGLDTVAYEKEILRLREDEIRKFVRERGRLEGNGMLGIKHALEDYARDSGNLYVSMAAMVGRTFKGLEDQLVQMLTGQTKSWRGFFQMMAEEAARISLQQAMAPFYKKAGDWAGKAIDYLGNIGSAPAGTSAMNYVPWDINVAATGAHFQVGGSGGTDSQLVQFKATPGEDVIVRTPQQQQGGGGGISVVNHITVPVEAGQDPGQAQQLARAIAEEVNARVDQALNNHRRPGGFLYGT